MRSETATAGRVRIVIALAVAGALTFMLGVLLVVVGVALQTVGKHPDQNVIALGAETAVGGFSFGMIVLAILVLIRGGISAPANQVRPAAQARGAGPRVAGATRAPGGARWATGAPQTAGAPPGRPAPGRPPPGWQPRRAEPPHRPHREQVLNPTNVITPGGLLDMPGSAPRGAFAQDQVPPGYRAGAARPPAAPTVAAGPVGPAAQGRPNWAPPGSAHQPGPHDQPGRYSQRPQAPRESVWPEAAPPEAVPQEAAPPEEEMYVYRDDGAPEEPLTPAAAPGEVDEREAAYWYGTGDPEPAAPEMEVRGPFEPLLSSNAAGIDDQPGQLDEPGEPDEPEHQHEQKLEQIKDFYLTAEAIGEENVDKHFDQLLAQQRTLIDEYFKHSRLRTAEVPAAAEVPVQEQATTAEPEPVPDAVTPSSDW